MQKRHQSLREGGGERERLTYIKACVLFDQPAEVLDDGLSSGFNMVKLIFELEVKLRPTTQKIEVGIISNCKFG